MDCGKCQNSNFRKKGKFEGGFNVSRKYVKCAKPSMIPVMKNDKVETKTCFSKKRPVSSKSNGTCREDRKNEDFEYELNVLREKEKAIKAYYLKIEELIQKSMIQKEENEQKPNTAKKMTSDTSVLSQSRMKNDISEFENNIQQISKIWLKTTSNLTSTLKNLKSNPSVNPAELKMENLRIQLAIKQAKSLSLVKTRSVIAEAKKLFQNREIIRSELENLLNQDNFKIKPENDLDPGGQMTFNQLNKEEQVVDETGDSIKDIEVDSLENIKENNKLESSENEDLERPRTKTLREDDFLMEKMVSDEISRERTRKDSVLNSPQIISEAEDLKKELSEKNKTITNLNKKIFDLQKTCNENSTKYNQLQTKLFEFHEKIKWNQVLWKQICKLKERIKCLQKTNTELEIQKKKLECKIQRRELEINKLLKLNHFFNRTRQHLNIRDRSLTECDCEDAETITEKYSKNLENVIYVDEDVIAQKHCAIHQLEKILNVMKEQEDFAQKRISMFQSKICEFEKNGKT